MQPLPLFRFYCRSIQQATGCPRRIAVRLADHVLHRRLLLSNAIAAARLSAAIRNHPKTV